jgi:amino acid adenylation domain-containing protein
MHNNYNLVAVDFNPFEGNEIEKIAITNEPQREVWLSCILGGEEASLAYNESVSLELKGKFNEKAFEKAVHDLMIRHEGLRAVLSKNGEDLIIYKEISFDIVKSEDLSEISLAEKELNLKSFIQDEMGKSFDLYNGPLFRIYLHKLDEDLHYFTIIIHHLIGDGWSLGIILEDLSLFYNAHSTGKQPFLPKAEQISDYATQQTDFVKTQEYRSTTDFWLNKYKDNVPVINLPLDFNRPALRTYKGKRNDYKLSEDLLSQIQTLSKQTGSSLVVTLVAVFEVLLFHRTGQKDLVVGLPSAGQLATENLRLVGHCVNLLPLLSKIDPEQPFIDYLKKRRSEIYDAYDHQRLTFSELIRKLNLKRDKALVPLVPVVFNVDMGMDEKVEFTGLNHRLISNPRVSQTFEISLNVNGSKNALTFEWAYNSQLFTSATIDVMMQEFELLLRKLTAEPGTPIQDAIIHQSPFPEIAVNHCIYPKDKTFVDLFYEQAANVPDHIAIVFEDKKLSYAKLDDQSNKLANYLISKGAKPGIIIPICIKPSLEMLVGILGILKSGAAYLPIDIEFPPKRISFMLSEANIDFIISDSETAKMLAKTSEKEVICLDDSGIDVWKASTERPTVTISPINLLYIIYTSGSTGNPKGVMIGHGSLVDYLFGLKANLPILESCKSFALGSTIATDLGNTILYSALALGSELHIFSKNKFNDTVYIHDYFNKHHIDCLKIVPSQWKFLNQAEKALFPEKLLMFGGESLPGEFIKEIDASAVKCEIVNHYGPTETTIGKLLYRVDKKSTYPVTVPIGRPFSNASILVLNSNLRSCPAGIPGELYIGGVGVAQGYLNNQELTNKVFVKNLPEDKNHGIFYKTGDLVRWLPDGNIEYLGRIDDQIKIRGNRIELGEIQNVLQKHKDIKQCTITVEEHPKSGKMLAAYVVPEGKFDKEAIISYLRESLPDYMVPRILIPLDKIPLTANGKVDRKALPKYDLFTADDEKTFVAPKNDEQKLIADIWAKHLFLEKISINDDFFELGGHSMIAIKIMVEIEKQTGIRLPLAVLFDNSTIEKLALSLSKPDHEKNWKLLIPIKNSGNKPPLYIIHGQGMNIIIFKSLVQEIDKDQPILGLQPLGLNPEDEPADSIEGIAEGYVNEIIKNDPEGPYLLMGYSSGGTIALEMSEQFRKLGKRVSFLGLLDTYYDGDSYSSLLKEAKFGQIFDQSIKTLGYAFVYFFSYPKDFIMHKKNFALGSLYNYYKKFNPIKEDPSNPLYVIDKIQKAHKKAFKRYKLKRYQEDVVLFKANDKKMTYVPHMESNGFAPYMGGKLTLVDIPLEHLKFFAPDHVHVFAEKLQSELNKSHLAYRK